MYPSQLVFDLFIILCLVLCLVAIALYLKTIIDILVKQNENNKDK